MNLYHLSMILLFATGYSMHSFACEAPNAMCHYGHEKTTFESVLSKYTRYQPQYSDCRSKDTSLDTDLAHGIRMLDPDLVAESVNKRKSRNCPVPLYPQGEHSSLQGLSAQIIAAVQLELVMRNQEPEETIQTARNIVTIVSGGATEYMIQKWNPKGYGRHR